MNPRLPPAPEPGTRLRHAIWGWGTVKEQRTYHHNTVSLVIQFDQHGEKEAVWKFIWDRCQIDDGTITKERLLAELRRARNMFMSEHALELPPQENFLHATPPSAQMQSRTQLLAAVERTMAYLEKP